MLGVGVYCQRKTNNHQNNCNTDYESKAEKARWGQSEIRQLRQNLVIEFVQSPTCDTR